MSDESSSGVAGSDRPIHPIEVRRARPHYFLAVLLRSVGSPSVLVSAMAYLLVVSSNAVTPIAGPVTSMLIASYVQRRFEFDAWAHIPRRRQDLARAEPRTLTAATSALEISALVVALSIFVESASTLRVEAQAVSVVAGSVGALTAVSVLSMVWDTTAPRSTQVLAGRTWITRLSGVLQVLILVITLTALTELTAIDPAAAALGASVVVGMTMGCLLLRLIPSRATCIPRGLLVD